MIARNHKPAMISQSNSFREEAEEKELARMESPPELISPLLALCCTMKRKKRRKKNSRNFSGKLTSQSSLSQARANKMKARRLKA